ncbi:uncharacterized protein LOC131641267 [Vicia villosa]|uniref:uncharacterized protein LOC131641267 n=1 Tax=Vicia villosa TaxID=3911 RepID=UPI00273B3D69|nr:uncharacterized protein LOC131641267 [Vicia villosa]
MKNKTDIFLIQETKISNLQEFVALSFWCNKGIGFSFSNSVRRSGGLLILWKEESLEVISSFRGEGFLGVKFMKNNNLYYLVNIYSSCDLVKKRLLWSSLLELKEKFNDGDWIMGGDFNAVKERGERKGRSMASNYNNSLEFSAFIEDSRLVDIPCKGKKFTWYSGDGKSMSRIDRFLVVDKVVRDWGVVGQFVGNRDVSDHCPIWLEIDNNNWGPKPFFFNNDWFSFDTFFPFVERESKGFRVEDRGDFVLKEKLRLLKDRLRWWNKEVFGRMDLDVEEGVRDINIGDDRLELEAEDLNIDILKERKEATSRFWTNLRIKENMLAQKSRIKWLKEGDSNSGFFHKVVREKRRRNHIGPINSPTGYLSSVMDIKEEVVHHFSSKFKVVDGVSPSLDGILFDKISVDEKGWLERSFQEDEVKEAIDGCGVSKSPGPDGFSFLFIKRCWSFLKEDFMRF